MEFISFETYIIFGVLVWRITRLICFENGPFDLLLKLRGLLYKNKLGKLLECFHCFGIWVSIVICLLFLPFNHFLLVGVFSVSGLASIIELFLNKHSNEQEFTEF